MKKNNIIVIVTVVLIIVFIAYHSLTSLNAGKKLVSSEDNIIGIWDLKECKDEKPYIKRISAMIIFNEDGSCHYEYTFKYDNRNTFTEEYDGTCYLSKDKTKLKMENEEKVIIKWNDINRDGDTLVIDNCSYSKVS